ncbi:hypothetical protein [Halarsenatibacter silvermanii]|uniref:Phage transcriptional activator, RinA family n=1 Tax=Halarsenatibacter silvermanii TaxID=321763 RepID=A0A1G9R9J6_9FIRM|nr:hypothetical protein [Halarsenatibacter silvermanii]SDM19989.1 phage transcriptional activator, RinA family [Halarsenatibacter silvermanii]
MVGSGPCKEVKHYIERELYDFEFNKRELEELKMDLTLEQLNQRMEEKFSANSSEECYSATEDTAMNLLTNKIIIRTERILNAIQRVIDRLYPDKRKFYEVFYRQGKSRQRTCIEVGISMATLYNWRNEIVKKTAKELGLF